MAGQTIAERATALLGPHQPGNPVILPTGWDAWSVALATDAGSAALTVGSHPSLLGADSLRQTGRRGHVVRRRVDITAAVDIRVSVDIESGYGSRRRA
jgi:2-methylisocitrate lyase-like PEP mutase family enzyme